MCHKNAIEMINTKKSYSVFYSVHFVTFGPVGSQFGGGAFYCKCERTKTQRAQYNEFGREAGLRTGPL